MTYKKNLGDYGENLVATYLEEKSYKILARNYRKPYGEVDIIARKDKLIAFVEVKTRSNNNFSNPREAVNFAKQQRIIKASQAFLIEKNLTDYIMRFDVCEVLVEEKELNYIENAF
ncbi:YraN family protein [Anaerococcus sp. AGMB09787]|uniref:YraN family protein n=1 Tax=Anaerococcus sp. AGMB09787 TaxID=2922869 RepID=UPI001FAFCA5F|nr:YraN family protein [Anaerococcus sp. AGMB09787]